MQIWKLQRHLLSAASMILYEYTQGGAWCNTTEDCSSRSLNDLGSSKFMKPIEFEGMLSNNHTENPCT